MEMLLLFWLYFVVLPAVLFLLFRATVLGVLALPAVLRAAFAHAGGAALGIWRHRRQGGSVRDLWSYARGPRV